MRALYLLLGLTVGLGVASLVGLHSIEQRDRAYEREILAFTLTGFSEGWTRGRDYTAARYRWMYGICLEERSR